MLSVLVSTSFCYSTFGWCLLEIQLSAGDSLLSLYGTHNLHVEGTFRGFQHERLTEGDR